MTAMKDRNSTFAYVAFRWWPEGESWVLLCFGRDADEFNRRLDEWKRRGICMEHVRVYATLAVQQGPADTGSAQ